MTHPLRAYLEDAGLSAAAFARRVGMEEDALGLILTGVAPPLMVARRISAATGGAVALEELIGVADAAGEAAEIDVDRLSAALMGAAAGWPGPKLARAVADLGAEAAANACAALGSVSNRRGRDLLLLALRPVLSEILKETEAAHPSFEAIDRSARDILDAYYR